jgi:hypothetical protein
MKSYGFGPPGGADSFIATMDMAPDDQFAINFTHIEDVRDAAKPRYNQIPIIGRSTPVMTYESTDVRTVSLDLMIVESINDSDRVLGYNKSDVVAIVNRLRSLAYPDYKTVRDLTLPPSRVNLVVGGFIDVTAVVTDCSVVWKKPWSIVGNPLFASVHLDFTILYDVPPGNVDIIEAWSGGLPWKS